MVFCKIRQSSLDVGSKLLTHPLCLFLFVQMIWPTFSSIGTLSRLQKYRQCILSFKNLRKTYYRCVTKKSRQKIFTDLEERDSSICAQISSGHKNHEIMFTSATC